MIEPDTKIKDALAPIGNATVGQVILVAIGVVLFSFVLWCTYKWGHIDGYSAGADYVNDSWERRMGLSKSK